MKLFARDIQAGLDLAERVDPKYAPVWRQRPAAEQASLAMYFLPHRSAKPTLGVTRPRVVKWYCPFADQRTFPSGHRYCINVYTGCSHGCVYCYAAGYLAMDARAKADFRRLLRKDLAELDAYDVPPAPVHVSNSTDAFQEPLECQRRDALFALRQLARFARRFTTVTVVTKNPAMLARGEYLAALRALKERGRRIVIEVSLAFPREEVAAAYEPGAPSAAGRRDAVGKLRSAGLAVVLRVSPTYPVGLAPPGLACPQTAEDMAGLARFAAELGVEKLVHTPAKIVRPKRGPLHPLTRSMLALYRRLAGPGGLKFRGGAWRLPEPAARRHVVRPLREICDRYGVATEFCKHHLLETR